MCILCCHLIKFTLLFHTVSFLHFTLSENGYYHAQFEFKNKLVQGISYVLGFFNDFKFRFGCSFL